MPSTLEDMLSGKGQGSYTPNTTPVSAFERGSYLSPEELSTIQGFAGVRRDPKGNYGGFNADQVRGFQSLYNTLTPEQPIKVDGIHGDQTAAAAYDLLSRYGSAKPSKAAPSYTPTEEAHLSFDEYTGRSPLADIIEQFKPKKDISEERMNRAAGFAALGAALRNVIDANYGSQGAQIVQHTDPEWVMRLAQRSEQLKDQRKGEELRYNMLRLQDAMRGRDRYDAYRDRIMERNMNNRDYATRQKFEDENKQYWYDRQRADHLSDYNRNKADQYTMMDKQTAKQKELARFRSNLQEGAFERKIKKMQELGVTSSGKPANGASGGGGKLTASDGRAPYFTASVQGSPIPLTKGEFAAVSNWVKRSGRDVINYKTDAQIVQAYMGEYIKEQQRWQQRHQKNQPSSVNVGMHNQPAGNATNPATQQPAYTSKTGYYQTTGAPPSASIPNTVQLLMKRGKNYQEAQDAFGKMQANGIDDETAYNMLMQADD